MPIPAGGLPPPGAPDWAPTLPEVADYIPRLTVDVHNAQLPTGHGTFTANTNPTDQQASRLINAAAWSVQGAAGTIPTPLQPHARVVAALRAAASIERGYVQREDTESLEIAAALDARADAELARLIAAVADHEDGTPDGGANPLPLYSFPKPVGWGDDLL